jgi:DNA-binding transcriptional LysR family regulator
MQKSTVSRRIVQLEERLGVRLINRTTRRLRLTEVGQAYYERCRQIMLDFAEAEQAVMQLQQAPAGLLRISAPIEFGQWIWVGCWAISCACIRRSMPKWSWPRGTSIR